MKTLIKFIVFVLVWTILFFIPAGAELTPGPATNRAFFILP